MFDILHVSCNGLITLLRTGKILAMDHDPSAGGRDICLLKGGPHSPRCGGGGKKLHECGRDGFDNCFKKQLILSKPEYNPDLGREKQHRAELSSLEDTTLSHL